MFRNRFSTAVVGAATANAVSSSKSLTSQCHYSTGGALASTKPCLAFQPTKPAAMFAPTAPHHCSAVPAAITAKKKTEDEKPPCTRLEKVVLVMVIGTVVIWYRSHPDHANVHTPHNGHTIKIKGKEYVLTPEQHSEFIDGLRARFGPDLIEECVLKDANHDWETTLPKLQAAEGKAIARLHKRYGRVDEMGDVHDPRKWGEDAEFMDSVQAGDIVIFCGYGGLADSVKFGESLQLGGTNWEHAALVTDQIKDNDGKVVDAVVVEATLNKKEKLKDYYTGEVYKGLRCNTLSQKVNSKEYEHIAIRRLKPEYREKLNLGTGSPSTNDTENRKKMWDVIRSVQGPNIDFPLVHTWTGFWTCAFATLHVEWNRGITWSECVKPGGRGVFCSQVVAEFLFRWGLIPNQQTTEKQLEVSTQFIPPMFTTHADLINEFYEKEQFIDCPDVKYNLYASFMDRMIDVVIRLHGGDLEQAQDGDLQ